MNLLPEEIEQIRDRKWRREEILKIETASEIETLVEDLGFCLGLTDSRTNLPSVYIAVCGTEINLKFSRLAQKVYNKISKRRNKRIISIKISPYAILVFVANGDRHYSPARIAGSAVKNIPSLKATNNCPLDCCSPSASGSVRST